MAFVYRSQKKASHIRTTTNQLIGPGSYVQHQSYTIQKAYAPFNTKEDRGGKKNKDVELFPGPGQYQVEKSNLNEKVVVSSANDDIKIVEVPKPQANFKSQTKRFQNNEVKAKEQLPGPGQYEQEDQIKKMLEKGQNQFQNYQKQNIIDKLMKMNRYQSTPSIPSKQHTFGYTETENNDLTLNKIPGHQYLGTQKDSVGPGHYDQKAFIEQQKLKGVPWHKLQAARMQNPLSKSTLTVGPGSYDVQAQGLPLYKMKQSPGFASKTLRQIENRKGAVASQIVKQRMAMSQQSNKNLPLNEEESDSEEEYIEDAVPGPGHYNFENSSFMKANNTHSHSAGNFGSLSKRFTQSNFANPIGPGEYNPAVAGIIGKNPHEIKVRNPPFLSSDTRFQIKKIEEVKPGPGAYEPRINLEDKLIQKIQKGYRGNFGSTERRFKNANVVDEQPGPGAYIDITTQQKLDESEAQLPTSVFKSSSQRAIFKNQKDQKPPVGSYKLNYYDIEKKVNQEPEDPDIKIKVPNLGFNTSDVRFKGPDPKKITDEDEEELNVIKEKRKEETKFKKDNKHFLSKADRFNYKLKNQGPSPGQYYDNAANPWNKRTFNIHFADF
ncbi:hypothetical protein ABPG72_011242 [Tetrahymena utriculariae]